MKIVLNPFIDFQESFLIIFFWLPQSGRRWRQGNAISFCQLANRFNKGEVVHLHQKRYDITSFLAPKAIKYLLLLVNIKRGCFFGVERAEGLVVFTDFFKSYVLGDDINNICPTSNFCQFFFRKKRDQDPYPIEKRGLGQNKIHHSCGNHGKNHKWYAFNNY